MQGAQELRSEAHLQVRRNDEVAAQRRRWTFYEVITLGYSPLAAGERETLALLAPMGLRLATLIFLFPFPFSSFSLRPL
jgi:hypothetical protein